MTEESKIQIDALFQFLTELEAEDEEKLVSVLSETQTLEQKLRELEFGAKDKIDENLYFFSPIGVLEEKEDDQEVVNQKKEIQASLESLSNKLNNYKVRKQQIEAIRKILKEKQESVKKGEQAEVNSGSEDASKKDLSLSQNHWNILEAQENERNRIAADLHDSTVQTLTSLVHKTEFCLLLMDTDSVRVKLELQKMIDTIKSIINEIRDIIFNLRPMNLHKNKLSASIEAYCLQVQKTRSIISEVEVKGQEPEVLTIWKLTLYRIFQEAIGNVVRHSGASKMKTTLSFEETGVHMIITDNGKGFDTSLLENDNNPEKRNFGISLMKERATLLNGTFDFKSVIGEGTTIDVVIPYQIRKEFTNEPD